MSDSDDLYGDTDADNLAQMARSIRDLSDLGLVQALTNVGCHVRCDACVETFFTGSAMHLHTCSRPKLWGVKCLTGSGPSGSWCMYPNSIILIGTDERPARMIAQLMTSRGDHVYEAGELM